MTSAVLILLMLIGLVVAPCLIARYIRSSVHTPGHGPRGGLPATPRHRL